MIWALQLNIDQLGNSFNSHLEKQFMLGSSKVTQSPKTNGDRAGQPAKEEEKRVLRSHDRTGENFWKEDCTKCKQMGYLKNRDDADKFNFAMDDENIDSNISGVPDAMVKRSHGINVHLIQQIENHFQRQALQSDLQQHKAFNPFSNELKDAIMVVGNTELCEIVDVEPKSQCKACLTYWSAGIVYCTCGHLMGDDTTENEKCRAGHTVTGTGRKKVAMNTTRQNNFKRGVERNTTKTFTINLSVTRGSERR